MSDWIQEATIKLSNLDGTAYDPTKVPTYDHTNDTTDASVTYKIVNSAGYELPATGGEGYLLFSVLGTMMALTATICLMGKKRRETACSTAYTPRR